MWPFRLKQLTALTEAYRDRDEALALVDKLDKVARRYKLMYEALLAEAYVRGPKGHFQRAKPLPTPPETNA